MWGFCYALPSPDSRMEAQDGAQHLVAAIEKVLQMLGLLGRMAAGRAVALSGTAHWG